MSTAWRERLLAHLEVAVSLAAVLVGCLSMRTFYVGVGWFLALAGGAVLGYIVVLLAAWRGWPDWFLGAVAVVVLAFYVLYACALHETNGGLPDVHALASMGRALTSGWANLLTVSLPADASVEVLVLPVTLAYAAGLVSALMLSRTRWVMPLLLPPLLLLVGGLAVTAPRPGEWIPLVTVLAALLQLLVLVRGNGRAANEDVGVADEDAESVGVDVAAGRWRSAVGRIGLGLPSVLIASILGAVLAAPLAARGDRVDPRAWHQQHYTLSEDLSPLVEVKPQLRVDPPRDLFRVRVTPAARTVDVDRIRVAALDRFDGALWSRSRDFLVAGSDVDNPVKGASRPVRLDVRATALPQPFLPVVGQPVHLSGQHLAYDPATGTLVTMAAPGGSSSYSVEAEVPVKPEGDRARRTVAPPRGQRPDARLDPPPPSLLLGRADAIIGGRASPWDQLLAIETALRQGGYSLRARPGSSYGAIEQVLLDDGARNNRVGYAEQYASAFAVLARRAGFPARVAVGYTLRSLTPDSGGWYTVTTRQADAWPEVLVPGYGWVAFDPTPYDRPAPGETRTLPNPPPVTESPREAEPADQGDKGPGTGAGGGTSAGSTLPIILVFLLAVIVLVAIVLAAIVGAKEWRRRRRRHLGPPSARIAAAWRETKDRLGEVGAKLSDSHTPLEVAGLAGQLGQVPGDEVRRLASMVTVAACAPWPPTEEQSERAWAAEATIRRQLTSGRSPAARVKALLDPRPLLEGWNPQQPAAGRRRRRRSGV